MANFYPNNQYNIEHYNVQPGDQRGRPNQYNLPSDSYRPVYYQAPPNTVTYAAAPYNLHTMTPPKNNLTPQGVGFIEEPPEHDKIFLNENLSVELRHGFIRKVYGLLTFHLLVTFSIILASRFIPAFHNVIQTSRVLFFVALAGCFIISLAMVCFVSISRKFPWNIYLMLIFSVFMGVLLSYSTLYIDGITLLEAVGLTGALVLAVTIFAFQTRIDFTGLGIYVIIGAIALMILSIVSIFIRNSIFHLVLAYLGAIFFTFVTIYDTQRIVGGKSKTQFSIDDYVLAAFTLYIDIIQLFQYILEILNFSSNE